MQVFFTPLLFTLAHKSAFESALALSRDVRAGAVHAPRRALLDTVVSGVPPGLAPPVATSVRVVHRSAHLNSAAASAAPAPSNYAVSHLSNSNLTDGGALEVSSVQEQPLRPHAPFADAALAASEAILGHRCNADQRAAVRELRDGVFAVHGPPGTGALALVLLPLPHGICCLFGTHAAWHRCACGE
jgi:hypothetical protein